MISMWASVVLNRVRSGKETLSVMTSKVGLSNKPFGAGVVRELPLLGNTQPWAFLQKNVEVVLEGEILMRIS